MINYIQKVIVQGAVIAGSLFLPVVALAQRQENVQLEQGFINPPASAWPRTW